MMKFKREWLFLKDVFSEFTETDPPDALTNNEFLWFYNDVILNLKIGQSVKTDFHKITRIE